MDMDLAACLIVFASVIEVLSRGALYGTMEPQLVREGSFVVERDRAAKRSNAPFGAMGGRGVGLAFQLGAIMAILMTAQQFLLVGVLSNPESQGVLSNLESQEPKPTTDEVTTAALVRDTKTNSTLPSARMQSERKQSKHEENVSDGVIARAFDPWDKPLPCFAPEDKKEYEKPFTPPSVHKGFMFMKLMKTGGSTAAGINIRIMRHAAEKKRVQDNVAGKFQFCQGRFEHSWGFDMLADREKGGASYLWTIVRDPTMRAVSQFFHFQVSREGTEASDYQFQRYLHAEKNTFSNYYLQVLTNEETPEIFSSGAPAVINKLFYEYDFIGVTERMDESAVALMMLLNVPMGSILYLNAKGNGGYDDGGYKGKCFFIQQSNISKGMKKFFDNRHWRATVKWDKLLHQAANRSLDMTIDRLGRTEFDDNLAKFRHAQTLAHERCLPLEVFPCTSSGDRNPNKHCLWRDSACGSDCLDELATELGLW